MVSSAMNPEVKNSMKAAALTLKPGEHMTVDNRYQSDLLRREIRNQGYSSKASKVGEKYVVKCEAKK